MLAVDRPTLQFMYSVLSHAQIPPPMRGSLVACRFEPFAAIRYATDDLAPVIAPPYDVLSDADVDALEAKSPHNVVRIDVPRGGEDRYDVAAKTMHAWLDERVLVHRPRTVVHHLPHAFHRLAGVRRDITGVLGALEVVDLEAGGVLPARADHTPGVHRSP